MNSNSSRGENYIFSENNRNHENVTELMMKTLFSHLVFTLLCVFVFQSELEEEVEEASCAAADPEEAAAMSQAATHLHNLYAPKPPHYEVSYKLMKRSFLCRITVIQPIDRLFAATKTHSLAPWPPQQHNSEPHQFNQSIPQTFKSMPILYLSCWFFYLSGLLTYFFYKCKSEIDFFFNSGFFLTVTALIF